MNIEDIDITGFETILLDRDGTINVRRVGDYVTTWSQFKFLPNVLATIARFAKTAKHIFVVTNQRGVSRGKMTERQLNEIHKNMTKEITSCGGRIDKIYYCTSIKDTDHFRKPNIGMWEQIQDDFPDVRPETTIMIGDGDCDECFSKNCGIKFVRV